MNRSKDNGEPLIYIQGKAVSVLVLYKLEVSPSSLTRHRGPSVTQVLNTSPVSFPTNLYAKFYFNNLKGCVQTISCLCLCCFLFLEYPSTLHTPPPLLGSLLSFLFFIFWSRHVACRILVPQPGVESVPPCSGNWTIRKFPLLLMF